MKLNDEHLDALRELVNIGVGQAAGMLNEMIEFRICLQVPEISLISPQELEGQLTGRLGLEKLSSVELSFSGSFAGSAQLVFPKESAATLVAVLTGEEPDSPDLDDSLKIGTLSEVGNIVINGVMGSISNVLDRPLNYAVPNYTENDVTHLVPSDTSTPDTTGTVLLAQARFDIEALQVQGDIILFFDVASFDALLGAIDEVN